MALSINLESQAGRGGSWDICRGFDPSDSSILMVTLWTDAVPVFLPKTCWLGGENSTIHIKNKSRVLSRERPLFFVLQVPSYFHTESVRYFAGTYRSS